MHPIFARIFKVDEESRTVTGRAAQEVIDRDREIFDYASSKPEFMKWSAEVSADTGGKSLGNVRSMHGNIAAGKLTNIDFNDVEKAIDISAKIVDDNEWDKVLEGVHTGFSIGGRYAKKWAEAVNGMMIQRYTAVPNEISIVDRPCCPTAKFFSIHKRDGSVVEMEQISEDSDGVVFENGLFVYKGGPGSGPHGGGGKDSDPHSQAGKAVVESQNARSAVDWNNDPKGASLTAKAGRTSRNAEEGGGTSQMNADRHEAASEAHVNAAEYHEANGNQKAADAHYAASVAHQSAADHYSKKSDSGDLEKGGPGSGPHPGAGHSESSREDAKESAAYHQRMADMHNNIIETRSTSAIERDAHQKAADAHEGAAARYEKAAEAFATGKDTAGEEHMDRAERISERAEEHSDKTKEGRAAMARDAYNSGHGKSYKSKFVKFEDGKFVFKGGPGSGPHGGGGKKDDESKQKEYTDHANAASSKASGTKGTPEQNSKAHQLAAYSHAQAAEHATKMGNSNLASTHAAAAVNHLNASTHAMFG